jgi:hypothetical protein
MTSILKQCDEYITFRYSTPITGLFKVIETEIIDVMNSIGEKIGDYHITIYPFGVERIDGQTIPLKLSQAVQERFKL